MPVEHIPHLVGRIQEAFTEAPDLRLTLADAQQLWNMDAFSAQQISEAPVEDKLLSRTREGTFMRAPEGRSVRRR